MRISLFLAGLLLLTASAVSAGDAVVLINGSGSGTITKSFEIFEDTSRVHDIEYVHGNRSSLPFRKVFSDSVNLGFSDSVHWLHGRIINKTGQEDWLIEVSYPCLDYVTFYCFEGDNRYISKASGDMVSFGKRDIPYRTFVFKLHVKRDSGADVYFRIHGEGPMIFTIYLYGPYAFTSNVSDEVILFGFYFGILFVMMVFNAFIFISTRDRSYLFYVLYILATFIGYLALNGFFAQYVLPDDPYIVNKIIPISISTMLCLASIFSKSFLGLHKNFRRGDVALIIAAVVMACVLAVSVFGSYNLSIKLCGALGSFVAINIIVVSSISLYRGNRVARFFLIAWLFQLIGMVLYALRSWGLVPDVLITSYGSQIGSVIDVVLLSIALADRINILKQENVNVQERIITMQQDYTASLETTVRERTAELEIERNKLKIRNDLIENELALARRIQEQLIPVHQPAAFIYSIYKPMEQVGGDFYDFIRFRDSDLIGIFLSDVSGHGVPAAFITSMVKTIIMQAGESKGDPAELLLAINRVLYNQTGGNFITAFYGIYDPRDYSLLYSNAGHNPPLIIMEEGIDSLKSAKSVPIGIVNNSFLQKNGKSYVNSRVTLSPDSKILFFTDGFVEARPVDDEDLYFEYSVMNDILLELKKLPPESFIRELYAKLEDFRGSDSFEDDVCMICLDVQ